MWAVCAAVASGCSTAQVPGNAGVDAQTRDDRDLVLAFFADSNAAATQGAQAQSQFFADTQHPDFPIDGQAGPDCADPVGNDLTVVSAPTVRTVRPDPEWRYPDGDGDVPSGRVYMVAATIDVQQGGNEVASVIAIQHVVVLDGRAVSFAPCLG